MTPHKSPVLFVVLTIQYLGTETLYVGLIHSKAAAPLSGTIGTPKWVRVKISSTIIHGTPPIPSIPPPCEKSALHCSEERQNGESKRDGEREDVKMEIWGERVKEKLQRCLLILALLVMKRGCNGRCTKHKVQCVLCKHFL